MRDADGRSFESYVITYVLLTRHRMLLYEHLIKRKSEIVSKLLEIARGEQP